jgi:DNA-binding HxlR family transcriptional regulator
LSETTVTGDGIQPRTGAQALAFLAVPLNARIVRGLQDGPRLLDELRRECGSPPLRALRSRLRELKRQGLLASRGGGLFFAAPREYDLTKRSAELRFVIVALERWLFGNRGPRLELATEAGSEAIRTVLDAWSSNIMRAVAARPCSLAELSEAVGPLDNPSLESRVGAMRRAGLLALAPGGDEQGVSYERTAWLCRAMGPILAASRWERHNLPDASARIRRPDAETALLLTMPLLQLPPTARGTCRLVVEVAGESGEPPATVTATADGSRVTACEPTGREADASASGPPSAWFRAAIEANPDHLEVAGDRRLARNLLDALYSALYSIRAPTISISS